MIILTGWDDLCPGEWTNALPRIAQRPQSRRFDQVERRNELAVIDRLSSIFFFRYCNTLYNCIIGLQTRIISVWHTPARRHQGFGSPVRTIRSRIQIDSRPGNVDWPVATDQSRIGTRETENRHVQQSQKTKPTIHHRSKWLIHLFLLVFFRLLYSVLPPSVANELRHGRPVAARRYEMVTLLFSGIVGFRYSNQSGSTTISWMQMSVSIWISDLCARNSDASGVMKVVRMLNVLYTTFDVLTDPRKNPNIYKVKKYPSQFIATIRNF